MRIWSLRWVITNRKPSRRISYRWRCHHNSALIEVKFRLQLIEGFFLRTTGCKLVTVAWIRVSLALFRVTETVKMRQIVSNQEVLRAHSPRPTTLSPAPRSWSKTRTTKACQRSKLVFHSNWLRKVSSIRRSKPHLWKWFLFKKSLKLWSSQLMMLRRRMALSAWKKSTSR